MMIGYLRRWTVTTYWFALFGGVLSVTGRWHPVGIDWLLRWPIPYPWSWSACVAHAVAGVAMSLALQVLAFLSRVSHTSAVAVVGMCAALVPVFPFYFCLARRFVLNQLERFLLSCVGLRPPADGGSRWTPPALGPVLHYHEGSLSVREKNASSMLLCLAVLRPDGTLSSGVYQ